MKIATAVMILLIICSFTGLMAEAEENTNTYKVQSGDTLWRISVEFHTSVSDLMTLNHLSDTTILTGQELIVAGVEVQIPVSGNYDVQLNENVIDIAMNQSGVPYVWGGAAPGGFDCSGFVYYVFREAGFDISRTNAEGQHALSYSVLSPEPGDLVFFENTYKPGILHVGIYIGSDQFIHANDGGVQITRLENAYWEEKFEGFRRLIISDN